MREHKIANIVGVFSLLFPLYFWLLMLTRLAQYVHYRGAVASLMYGLVLALFLSLIAALRASRYWYLSTGLVLSTLLFIGLRLH